jgi:hypothetical protein
MKSRQGSLRMVALLYLGMWLVSGVIVYPWRLIEAIDSDRKSPAAHPIILDRLIVFAPGLALVDWQEGEGAFNSAGYQGLCFVSPFRTSLLWKRMTWIS